MGSSQSRRRRPSWWLGAGLIALTTSLATAQHAETLYFLGVERLDADDLDGAYALFKRIPTAPEVDLERSSYRDIGYRRELIQLLVTEGTEALDPTFNISKLKQAVRARARTRMAEIHMGRGQFEQAIEHLLIANRDDNGYPLAHCRLAECHLVLGQFGAAIDAAKEAYILSPTFRLYRRTYATAVAAEAERVERQGELGKAMLAYDFAFQIDPLNTTALSNYGHFLYRRGVTGYEDAAPDHPAVVRYNRLKGVYLMEQAAQLAPSDVRIQARIADVFRAEERADRALEFYERALAGGDPSPGSAKGAAWALIGLGEHGNAMDRLLALHRREPRDPEIHLLIGQIHLQQGRRRDAEKQAGAALKLDRDSAEAWYLLGACRLAAGKRREGMELLGRAAGADGAGRAAAAARLLVAQHALEMPRE